ncbi:hypothetical protein JW916_04155 [Candidatus Sumerlaeota bacterium]|nr:hypothetical protein [Candidatus Sumerlaeota bacterium]
MARRTRDIKTVRYRFEGHEFRPKGGTFVPNSALISPHEDVSLPFEGEILVRGKDVRYNVVRDLWLVDENRPVRDCQTLGSIRGDRVKEVNYAPKSTDEDPSVFQTRGSSENRGDSPFDDLLSHEAMLAVAISPSPPYIEGDAAILRMDRTDNGQRVVVGRDSGFTEYYLDPTREYVPTRHVRRSSISGELTNEARVEYRIDPEVGFVPARIVSTVVIAGRIRTSTELVVKEAVFNEDVSDSDFEIDFPPGTRVWNDRANVDQIVMEDGTMAPDPKSGDLRRIDGWMNNINLDLLSGPIAADRDTLTTPSLSSTPGSSSEVTPGSNSPVPEESEARRAWLYILIVCAALVGAIGMGAAARHKGRGGPA